MVQITTPVDNTVGSNRRKRAASGGSASSEKLTGLESVQSYVEKVTFRFLDLPAGRCNSYILSSA
jgi:hypothetical protein